MKLSKILFGIIATLALTGCANPNPTTSESNSQPNESESNPESEGDLFELGTWSEEESALIDQHIYGTDVPCFRIEGNSELYYDEEYDCLSITGAYVEFTQLESVANLFVDNGFELYNDFDDDTFFYLVKQVEYEGITRNVTAVIYAVEELYDELWEEYYEDYSTQGTFWLDLYDPYYYEWDSEGISYYVNEYFGSPAVIPSYEADYYEFIYDYVDFGFVYIACYTNDTTSDETYAASLEALNYSVGFDEDFGAYIAYDEAESVEVVFYHESGCLDIYIYDNSDSTGGDDDYEDDNGASTELDAYTVAVDYIEELGGTEDYVYYDDEYGCYWFLVAIDESEVTISEIVEEAVLYAPEYLVVVEEPYEGTWQDGTEGVFATLTTEDDSIYVYIGSYVEDGETVLQIDVYEY